MFKGAQAAWASKRVPGHPAKLDMFQWRYGLRDRLKVDDDGDEDGYCGHDHRNGGRDDNEEEEDQQL
ncbi:unnamed protein product [Sphagnum jensenii]